jgi:hypothetical protein
MQPGGLWRIDRRLFTGVRGIEILGSSPRASVDGIMFVVERDDPPAVSGTERRTKRAHGVSDAVTSLSIEQWLS